MSPESHDGADWSETAPDAEPPSRGPSRRLVVLILVFALIPLLLIVVLIAAAILLPTLVGEIEETHDHSPPATERVVDEEPAPIDEQPAEEDR